jgi:prepilin-type N-terminal cleavage/methylation domain-containing protein
MLTTLGRRTRGTRSGRRERGFTLIELVSAIVILGVIAAVALPLFHDLRYDARVAAMRQIEAAIVANQVAAMQAWAARGSAGDMTCFGLPTDSVVVGGKQISVFGKDAAANPGAWGSPVVAGAPTPCGMWIMMGCGTTLPATPEFSPCNGVPGYNVALNGTATGFTLGPPQPSGIPGSEGYTFSPYETAWSCWIRYWSAAGFSYAPSDVGWFGTRSSVIFYYARDYVAEDGRDCGD